MFIVKTQKAWEPGPLRLLMLVALSGVAIGQTSPVGSKDQEREFKRRTFYVRQTVGDDSNDGLSPQTAWRHISKLSRAMAAGDTAIVGPGLYRDAITVENEGTPENRLTFIADSAGRHTGDPPGVVMVTGADPVDESIFQPHSTPGVFVADVAQYHPVGGVVEMDGEQYRYQRARSTKEHLRENLSELQVVSRLPSSYFYDKEARTLYIHTSDGQPPETHEIELLRRGNGISMYGKHFITVVGFTFRHMGDAGINFFRGSGDGIAIGNTSYGSRQGIRVYDATNVCVYANTLFRNENCGVYFAKGSVNGRAIGNTLYENIKGVRWSSASVNGQALGNTAFDNHEAGISIEEVDGVLLAGNSVINNKESQLLVIRSEYDSEGNCFENGGPDQLTAYLPYAHKFKTLGEYQRAAHRDLSSREGDCGPPPKKLDVHKLHAATTAYTDWARKQLAAARDGEDQNPPE